MDPPTDIADQRLRTAGMAGAVLLVVFWAWVLLWADALLRTAAVDPLSVIATAAIGIGAGLLGTGPWGLAGAVAGVWAAIALRLFYVVSLASWWPQGQPADVPRSTWLPGVASALLVVLLATIAGFAVGAIVRRLVPFVRTGFPSAASWTRAATAGAAIAVAACTLSMAVLVAAAAQQAYVAADDESVLTISLIGGQIVALDPKSVQAGLVTLHKDTDSPGEFETGITPSLDPAELAAIRRGDPVPPMEFRMNGPWGRWELTPGTKAVVTLEWLFSPPKQVVRDTRIIEVTPAPAPAAPAKLVRGQIGVILPLGFFGALALHGLGLWAFVLFSSGGGRGRAVTAALLASFMIGWITLFAIDLTHNPF